MHRSTTRRQFVAGAAAAALLLPRAGHAAVSPYALGPAWTRNWAVHRATTARIIQGANAVKVSTPFLANQLDEGQLALWARQPVSGDFQFSFDYLVTAWQSDKDGSFGLFYFDVQGEGSAAFPAAVPDWKGVKPSETLYASHARGLRFTFALHDPGDTATNARLRLRAFDPLTAPTIIDPVSAPDFPFDKGVPCKVIVERRGTKLTVRVVTVRTGKVATASWTNPAINRWGGGHLGFRWRAQDLTVVNPVLKQL